jgi:calcium-dependent protein kinase
VILYILLSGVHPFGNSADKLLEKNKSGRVYFQAEHWENVSKNAIDLVTRMLDSNPSTRISIHDALAHPWITQNLSDVNQPAALQQKVILEGVPATVVRNPKPKLSVGLMHRLVGKACDEAESPTKIIQIDNFEVCCIEKLLREAE